ncbi:branched-chain amino acid:cation transporter, LIVCS family [Peptoclostridium litorale DSM 5388]|uniref:Branched-chain amino acid transport system carrier protein n=1 Tax=Peptoclostridium litorale DSM 5388 TaxID=1121324 RepID=A0A069RB01_PEPLI|nr:branched-chain amino acid transport system II carrier protein [Peptoclostridium litorale]KDR94206.1 branched-chain amino acid transport system carrier protein BraB [Peptoclostridium litorale DSM 5388]SIN82279.1 branched-chain amino acid:cation transporter, LIVCS family [Peptoclostridium litorale DSM 5388]
MNRKMNQTKDSFVVGMALFAMFFGAGNLIFPPALGLASGKGWLACLVGFLLTGVGMPLLGVLSVSKAGGTIDHLAGKVNPTFSKILGTVIILALGPLLAIPRTGATVFELGIRPSMPGANPIVVSIVYFAATLFLVIKPSGIVDKIGKVLTPILLCIIGAIIIKGTVSPAGMPVETGLGNPFSVGFTEGYQTMDAFCALVFGGILMLTLKEKGYEKKEDQIKLTMRAGLIAAVGLAFVYGGLLYLGSTVSGVYPSDIARADLVVGITQSALGSVGKIGIGIACSVACLTTAVGITATVGNYFEEISNGKLSYRAVVIATVVVSAIFSNFGIENIVKLAVPLLVTVYPVAIVLIVMNLFDNLIKNKKAYLGAVYGALFVSLFDGISAMGVNTAFIGKLMSSLPLSGAGFAWITPSIAGAVITTMLMSDREKSREESSVL